MVAPDSAESREFRQMRDDVDDGYALLESIGKSVTTISATQRRHGNRLEEIQQSVDLQSGRLDRMEDNQRQQAARLGRVEGRLEGVTADWKAWTGGWKAWTAGWKAWTADWEAWTADSSESRTPSSRSWTSCGVARRVDQPPDPYGRVMISRLCPSGESK